MASKAASLPGANCFFPRVETRAENLPVLNLGGLSDRHAMALARLLPLLGCGEEAAALSFDRLSEERGFIAAAHSALSTVASEERVHDRLIAAMRSGLPVYSLPLALEQQARRLHLRIGRGKPTTVLARIAALDAAVCTLLGRIVARGTPVARSIGFGETLARIQRDESRHVQTTRSLVLADQSVPQSLLDDEAHSVRDGLAALLEAEADAFEVLHVDFKALKCRIRTVPKGLFRA